MLSLDTRLVVDGSAVSMSVPPTSYSPVTPTDLTRAFEYDVGLSPVVAMHESGIKHEARSSSCEEDASLGEFDFGHDLPALSVGDSCSPATSPASSWIDDAHSAATPDPPAFDLVATTGSWDDQLSAGFAAPLDKDRRRWWATETVTDSEKAWASQHMSNMERSTSSIFGAMPEMPHSVIGAGVLSANSVGVGANPSAPTGPLVFDFDRQGALLCADGVEIRADLTANFDHGETGVSAVLPEPTTMLAPVIAAPAMLGADRADRLPGVPLPFDSNFGPLSDLSLDAYMANYGQFGRRDGTSPVLESRRQPVPGFRHPNGAAQQHRAEQQQQQQLFYQQQLFAPAGSFHAPPPPPAFGTPVPTVGVASAPNPGYVPVQFTTATGATYAVAIPIAASNQAAAIETPHGTYYFVPSPPAPSPSLPAPTQAPLGVMQTPPAAEAPLPPYSEAVMALPPLSLQPTESDFDATSPPAANTGANAAKKARPAPRRPRKATAKTAKQRSVSRDLDEPVEAAGVEPAKSDSFQLPQGPSAAQIAAENAAKAAARVAALGPTHKIRLPVGQGKRGSTKRKADSDNSGSNKKDQSRRFNCPHPGCGRGFARNFNMQSHYKSHLGVREYDCPWCTKKFSRRHDRARHCTGVHDAVVDREGNITGPHPVVNKNATNDDVASLGHADDDEDDIDAEGDYDYEHYNTNAFASPEERDSYGRGSIASVSAHLG